MAKRIQIKIDITKLQGALVMDVQGRREKRQCLVITTDHFYKGKDGALYLNFTGYEDESRSYGRIYSLKQNLSKEEYDRLKAEGKQTPYVGDIKEWPTSAEQSAPAPSPSAYYDEDDDDMPDL